jgi:uncharacterized protein
MRIVIIGGLGFIGKAVTIGAIRHGHEVIALTRQNAVKFPYMPGRTVLHWDGIDHAALGKIIEGSDAIHNLSGLSIGSGLWTRKRKQALLQSRLEPATALVEAIKMIPNPPKTVVQMSGVGIYRFGDQDANETSPLGNDYSANLAKEWEKPTQLLGSLGIRRIVTRTGIVLDRRHGILTQFMLPFQLFVGGPLGSGRQFHSWIHLQDAVDAILYLIEHKDCRGVYNLSTPNPVTNAQMGKAIAKSLNRPYWFPIPAFALKTVLGELSTMVLMGQKVLPNRLLEAGFQFQFPEIDIALNDLFK